MSLCHKSYCLMFSCLLGVGVLGTSPAWALDVVDTQKIQLEAERVHQMVACEDAEGLLSMLGTGEYPSRALAAEYLGLMGESRALELLTTLNEEHGGWHSAHEDYFHSGAFALAICRIHMQRLSDEEQVSVLFELLKGMGSAVPQFVKDENDRIAADRATMSPKRRAHRIATWGAENTVRNSSVEREVCRALADYNDPRIIPFLRKYKHGEGAMTAVWLEIRDLDISKAVDRCLEIAHQEKGWAAMECLGRLGEPGLKALKRLDEQGFHHASSVLDRNWYSLVESSRQSALYHKNVEMRAMAASKLLWFSKEDESALMGLIEVMRDPAERVRRYAATSLRNLFYYRRNPHCSTEVIQGLRSMVNHPDAEVASKVSEILVKHGWLNDDCEMMSPPTLRTDLGMK